MRFFTLTLIATVLTTFGAYATPLQVPRDVPPFNPPISATKRDLTGEYHEEVRRSNPTPTPDPSRTNPNQTEGRLEIITGSGSGSGAKRATYYVSMRVNQFGEYGRTSDLNQALRVRITYRTSINPQSAAELIALNGDLVTSYPYIGGIVGFASNGNGIGAGSWNYLYMGGTGRTPYDSPPLYVGNSFSARTGISKASESAIWKYDPVSRALSPQWVNPGGSKPATYIAYTEGAYVFTGDVNQFKSVYGGEGPIYFRLG